MTIKNWSAYSLVDGTFTQYRTSSTIGGNEKQNVPAGCGLVEGYHDHLSMRVDVATGQVIDYQPPAPSADHEWNATTKRWQLSAAAQAKAQARTAAAARIQQLTDSQHSVVRDLLLGNLDAKPRLQAIQDEIAALTAENP